MTILAAIALVVLSLVGLRLWRWSDQRYADRVWLELSRNAPARAERFDAAMVANLPEPARRYFLYTIRPGTPIRTVAEIRMRGEIGLGTKDNPSYLPMIAEQILAPPHGLVWKLCAGRPAMRITGSDGTDGAKSWVRFWLAGIVPVVRAGGDPNHARAAFGRVVAESVFWAPAALLPHERVLWTAVDHETARATISFNGMTQTVDVTVAETGEPAMVVIPRWTNANARKIYQLQPFGGYLSEFRNFGGYRLPTCVQGGNLIGTDDYFPFYKATVDELRFVGSDHTTSTAAQVSRS